MTADPKALAEGRRGFVLVAVLGGLLIVAAATFALLFTASLETMAARAQQAAVLQREELEAALALAAAELWHEGTSGAVPPDGTAEFGPWPNLGVNGVVRAALLEAEEGAVVLRLSARLPREPMRAEEALTLQVAPELRVLRR